MNKFNLEQRRKELGLTLEQIGNFVGVSKSTVKKWESGFIDNMKRDKIALLAEILRVSPLSIIGIESSNNNLTRYNTTELFTDNIKHIYPIISKYEKLNKLGKQKADEYINDLLENPRYTKTSTTAKAKIKSAKKDYEIAAWGADGTKGTYKSPPKEVT